MKTRRVRERQADAARQDLLSFKDPGIKGDKVSISWDTRNGSKVAEKVRILT